MKQLYEITSKQTLAERGNIVSRMNVILDGHAENEVIQNAIR
jgi:hypothetical protein